MKLFFREYGRGEALIILHGLLGSSDNWHSLSRRFADRFHVFSVDQRNHGGSPHSDEISYRAMSADLMEFLSHHNIASASIIGHSMGGKTAMQFALDHPELMQRLVVVDIGPKAYPSHHDAIFDALLGIDLRQYSSRREVDAALSRSISSVATRQFLLKNLKRNENDAFSWKMNLDGLHRHYEELNKPVESVQPFDKPTLFVRSLTATYVLDADLPGIRKLFPSCEVLDVDVGHWIHAEAPDVFFSAVMDFLTRPL